MLRITLNEKELQELEKRLKRAKSQSTLVYLDLKIIEFAHHGKSAPHIGKLLGLHPNTARTIIKKFQVNGFKGLKRKPRGKPEEKLVNGNGKIPKNGKIEIPSLDKRKVTEQDGLVNQKCSGAKANAQTGGKIRDQTISSTRIIDQ